MDKLQILKEYFSSGKTNSPENIAELERLLNDRTENEIQSEEQLLKAASLVRYFDENVYLDILQTSLAESSEKIEFAKFIKSEKLESIPRNLNHFRLKDNLKTNYLSSWKKELTVNERQFIEQLSSYYRQSEDELNLLGIEILNQPNVAKTKFLDLFEKADEKFDLARCNDYLCVLRDFNDFLSPEFRLLFEEKQQYLRTRNYFSPEYHKTVFYQTRESITETFKELLNPTRTNSKKWIFQLFAMGGMGKTMFVRWLVSRYLVPNSIPVARLDFDFLDLTTVSKYPWLLIIVIAEQLNFQISGSPFNTILNEYSRYTPFLRIQSKDLDNSLRLNIGNEIQEKNNEIETVLLRISNIFRESNFNKPFVVILDTLEKIVLHHEQKVVDVLKLLQQIYAQNSSMRLLLSGRYDLSTRISEFSTKLKKQTIPLELYPFNQNESFDYLSKRRQLEDAKIVEAIIQKCKTEIKDKDKGVKDKDKVECNPFKLSLFADFYQQQVVTTAEQILEFPRTDLAYLIYRIILQIKEPDVRWLLRYAVIPREFSFDFFEKVIVPHLKEELLDERNLDDANSLFPKGAEKLAEENSWEKEEISKQELNLTQTWNSLKNYASGYSWINFDENDNDLLRFQPDVVVPMRLLLENQKIFKPLHQDAIEYFENKANRETKPDLWAKYIKEAIYHLFQIDAPQAENYWRKQLNTTKAQKDVTIYKQLAEGILTEDFVDYQGNSLKINDGQDFLIRPQIILEARAKVVEASILLISNLKEEKAVEEWRNVYEHLNFLQTLEDLEISQSFDYQKPFQTQPLLSLAENFVINSGERSQLLENALETTESPAMKLSLEFLLGKFYAKQTSEKALIHYQNALNLRKSIKYPPISKAAINLAIGQFFHSAHKFRDAQTFFEKTLRIAKAANDSLSEIETLRCLSNLNLELGKYEEAYNLLEQIKQTTENNENRDKLTNAIFLSQIYARSFYQPLKALNEIPGLDSSKSSLNLNENAQLQELHGDIAGMLMQFDIAVPMLENAKNLWSQAAEDEGINRCRLLRLSYLLYNIGDFEEANYHLSEIKQNPPKLVSPSHIFQLETCDIFYKLKTGQKDEARLIWQNLLKNEGLNAIPSLSVQILALGIALNFADSILVNRFLKMLEKIKPGSARLPLLNIFDLAEKPFPVQKSAHLAEIKKLIESDSTGKDIIPHSIFRATALNFFGDQQSALKHLKTAEKEARKQNNPFVLKQIFTAKDRLDLASKDDLTTTDFFREFGNYNELCFAAYIEQAARFLNNGQIEKSKKCLGLAIELKPQNKTFNTQIEAIYYELLGEIANNEGDLETSSIQFKEAENIYQKLGQIENIARFSQKNILKNANLDTFEKTNIGAENVYQVSLSVKKGKIIREISHHSLENTQVTDLNNSLLSLIIKAPANSKNLYNFANQLRQNFSSIMDEIGKVFLSESSMLNYLNQNKLNSLDLSLNLLDPAFARIPWELASKSKKHLSASLNSFYRSNPKRKDDSTKTIWIQTVLRKLLDSDLQIDGYFGHQTHFELATLKERLNLPKDVSENVVNNQIKQELRKNIKTNARVLIIKPNREDEFSSQRASTSVSDIYKHNGFEINELYANEIFALPDFLQKFRPDVVHIQTSFNITTSRSEIYLDLLKNQNTSQSYFNNNSPLLSAEYLAKSLSQFPKNKLEPIIILDAIYPRGTTETILQLIYRNIFSHSLFTLGNFSAILATGLFNHSEMQINFYDYLANSLANLEDFGSISKKIRELSFISNNVIEGKIATQGVTLFTNNPELSILPIEGYV